MKENNKAWSLGAMTGVVATSLIAIGISKLSAEPPPIEMPKEIVESYNMGIKDALRTNPPSTDLENTCLELWANKQ